MASKQLPCAISFQGFAFNCFRQSRMICSKAVLCTLRMPSYIKNCRQHYGCFALIGAHQCSVLTYARAHTHAQEHTESQKHKHTAWRIVQGRDTLACTNGLRSKAQHTGMHIHTLTRPYKLHRTNGHTESTSCGKVGTQMKNEWCAWACTQDTHLGMHVGRKCRTRSRNGWGKGRQ